MLTIAQFHALAQAREHFCAGRLGEAETVCRQILTAAPGQSIALTVLGAIACQRGRHAEGADFFAAAAKSDPSSPVSWQNLGITLKQIDCIDDAIDAFSQVVRLDPANATAHAHLGGLHGKKDRISESLAAFEKALSLDPKMGEAWNNYGLILQRVGRLADAAKAYALAVQYRPDAQGAHVNQGNAFLAQGQPEEALACYARALALMPNYSAAHNNIGNALRRLTRLEEALEAYDRALTIDPNYVAAHGNRALCLADLGRFDEAFQGFARTLKLDPNFAEAHWNYACVLLLCGQYEAGWREYEWRWRWQDFSDKLRIFPQPIWEGEDIAGKRILVHAEQGVGDAIQFVRHAQALRQRGAYVIVECQENLVRLMRLCGQFEKVMARGEAWPSFDVHVPMLGLPVRMKLPQPWCPADGPYLHADPNDVQRWAERLHSSPKRLSVGLAWAGSKQHVADHLRSIPLSLLAPLSQIAGVQLYSLQKGEPAEQTRCIDASVGLIDCTDELHDWADTAAFISNLDLIITVDTAVAHLAGAMGKPTWILLPIPTDWRWGLLCESTEWYPSAKLFRQDVRGDWAGVIERVRKQLICKLAGG